MKRIITLFTFLTVCLICFAQVEQKGVVLKYNKTNPKTPLSGVIVKVNNADQVKTNNKGEFTLKFRNKTQGDKVTVSDLYYPGYIIMNSDDISKWSITPNEKFTIILIEEAEYHNLFRENLEIAKNALTKKYKDSNKDFDNEYYDQLESLEEYVEKLTRIDFSEDDGINFKMYDLFRKGKLEDAVSLFEQNNILGEYKSELDNYDSLKDVSMYMSKKKEEIMAKRLSLQNTILNQVNLLKMIGGKESYDKAIVLSKEFYEADPDNEEATKNYADLLYNQLNYSEAYKIYERLSGSVDLETSSNAKLLLSHISLLSFDFNKSIEIATPVLNVLDSISITSKESDIYLDLRAQSHFILMLSYLYAQDFANANTHAQTGISQYKVLSSRNPEAYSPFYNNILSQNCQLQMRIDNKIEAEASALSAIEVGETLYKLNPKRYRHNLGVDYQQMANFLSWRSDTRKAEEYYEKAEDLYEEGYKENSDLFATYLAQCYQNHGYMLLMSEDNFNKSFRPLSKALKLYESLYEKQEEYYAYAYSFTQLNIAQYYRKVKQYDKCILHNQSSLGILAKHNLINNPEFKKLIESTYIELTYSLLSIDKIEDALTYINKALEITPDRQESLELKKFTLQTLESMKTKVSN